MSMCDIMISGTHSSLSYTPFRWTVSTDPFGGDGVVVGNLFIMAVPLWPRWTQNSRCTRLDSRFFSCIFRKHL